MGIAVILAFLISPIIYAQAQNIMKDDHNNTFPKWFPLVPRRPPILMWPSVMNITFHNFKKEYKEFGLHSMGMPRKCYKYPEFRMQDTEVLSWVNEYIKRGDRGRQQRTLFPQFNPLMVHDPNLVCWHAESSDHFIHVKNKGKRLWTRVLPALTQWLDYRVRTCGIPMFFKNENFALIQLIEKDKHQWIQIILCVLSLILRTFVVIKYKNRELGFHEKPFSERRQDSNNVEKWVTLLENWVEKNTLQKSLDEIKQLIDTSFDIVTAIIMDYLARDAWKHPPGLERAQMRIRNDSVGRFAELSTWYEFTGNEYKRTLVQDMADNFFKCEAVNTCKCTKRPVMRKVRIPEYEEYEEFVPRTIILLSDPVNCTFKCTAFPEKSLYVYAAMATESSLHMLCPRDLGLFSEEMFERKNSFIFNINCYPLQLIKALVDYTYNTCGAGKNICVTQECDCPKFYTEEMLKLQTPLELQDLKVEEIMVV